MKFFSILNYISGVISLCGGVVVLVYDFKGSPILFFGLLVSAVISFIVGAQFSKDHQTLQETQYKIDRLFYKEKNASEVVIDYYNFEKDGIWLKDGKRLIGHLGEVSNIIQEDLCYKFELDGQKYIVKCENASQLDLLKALFDRVQK